MLISGFSNYLSDRMKCIQFAGSSSSLLHVLKGVPQGSILGLLLFSIYVNICDNVLDAAFHFYADDAVIYCSSLIVAQTFELLQSAFDIVQSQLTKLTVILNADKSKVMLF